MYGRISEMTETLKIICNLGREFVSFPLVILTQTAKFPNVLD